MEGGEKQMRRVLYWFGMKPSYVSSLSSRCGFWFTASRIFAPSEVTHVNKDCRAVLSSQYPGVCSTVK